MAKTEVKDTVVNEMMERYRYAYLKALSAFERFPSKVHL